MNDQNPDASRQPESVADSVIRASRSKMAQEAAASRSVDDIIMMLAKAPAEVLDNFEQRLRRLEALTVQLQDKAPTAPDTDWLQDYNIVRRVVRGEAVYELTCAACLWSSIDFQLASVSLRGWVGLAKQHEREAHS